MYATGGVKGLRNGGPIIEIMNNELELGKWDKALRAKL